MNIRSFDFKDWINRHKILSIIIILLCLFYLLGGCESSYNDTLKELEDKEPEPVPKIEEKAKTELEIVFDGCYDACWDKIDSTGGLLKGCYNNKEIKDITNLKYITNYCDCLKGNNENYCVSKVWG